MTFQLGHTTTCSYMYMFSLPKWQAAKLTYLRDRMSRPLTKFKDPNLPKVHISRVIGVCYAKLSTD